MMRNIAVIVFTLLCTCVHAQMLVEGKHVFLDEQTGLLLATIPERMFGQQEASLMVEKEAGWQEVCVEGTDIGKGFCSFSSISAESKWAVKATKADGTQVQATLQFTFLPIVGLLSSTANGFGKEYQEGTFVFSHPDSARTDTLTAKIKWRGGTTNAADRHKRNYKLNFNEDHRFFGLRNDDKWMLDAGQPDVFRMRNRIAMDLWNSMARKPYYASLEPKALNGVRGNMVELFLGDEYRGLYNFSEMMDRKQLKLKKLDKETGEIRGCLYKGVSWDKTQMFDCFDNYDNTKETLYGYEMKYPELGDDSDTVDWKPLVEGNNFARNSTNEEFQERIADYFDIPVLIDYNIFYNVVNAVDNAGKNMYWAVYDKTATKRLTPTPWDLDATFGQRWGGQLVVETEEGFFNSPELKLDFELMVTYRMFRDNANDYLGKLNERYRQLRQPGQPLHTDSIVALVTRYYHAVKNSGAAQREATKWTGDTDVWGDVINFDSEYAYICDWIRRRMDFIDQRELPLFYKKSYFDELDVRPPTISPEEGSIIYDLSGRKMITNGSTTGLKPGLYVRGGRKFIVR